MYQGIFSVGKGSLKITRFSWTVFSFDKKHHSAETTKNEELQGVEPIITSKEILIYPQC